MNDDFKNEFKKALNAKAYAIRATHNVGSQWLMDRKAKLLPEQMHLQK